MPMTDKQTAKVEWEWERKRERELLMAACRLFAATSSDTNGSNGTDWRDADWGKERKRRSGKRAEGIAHKAATGQQQQQYRFQQHWNLSIGGLRCLPGQWWWWQTMVTMKLSPPCHHHYYHSQRTSMFSMWTAREHGPLKRATWTITNDHVLILVVLHRLRLSFVPRILSNIQYLFSEFNLLKFNACNFSRFRFGNCCFCCCCCRSLLTLHFAGGLYLC